MTLLRSVTAEQALQFMTVYVLTAASIALAAYAWTRIAARKP